jgi:hypothetical protein
MAPVLEDILPHGLSILNIIGTRCSHFVLFIIIINNWASFLPYVQQSTIDGNGSHITLFLRPYFVRAASGREFDRVWVHGCLHCNYTDELLMKS